MPNNAELKVQVRASTTETDVQRLMQDLKNISKVLEKRSIPQVAVSVNKGKTEQLFKKQLNELVKGLNVQALNLENVKINLDTKGTIKEAQNLTNEIKNTIKSNLGAMPKLDLNLVDKNDFKNINKLQEHLRETISLQKNLKGYSVGKIKTSAIYDKDEDGDKVDTKQRQVNVELYNKSLQKAIELRFVYNSQTKEIAQSGHSEIQNLKRLASMQDAFQKKLEKQSSRLSQKGIAISEESSTYIPSANKPILDVDRLKIVETALADVQLQRDKMLQSTSNMQIVPESEYDKLDELIAKYKLVIKEQRNLEYAAGKLATNTLSQEKKRIISSVDTTSMDLKKDKVITDKDIVEVNRFKKAMNEAADSNQLREVNQEWNRYVEQIKRARSEIEKFNNAEAARATGRTLIPTDRSKGVEAVLARTQKEYSQKFEGAEVKVTASADMYKTGVYADGLTVSIKKANGEIEKFNLGLVKVGRSYQYLQSTQSKVTTSNSVDIKKQKASAIEYSKIIQEISKSGSGTAGLKKYESGIKMLTKDQRAEFKELIQTARSASDTINNIFKEFGGDFSAISRNEDAVKEYTNALNLYKNSMRDLSVKSNLVKSTNDTAKSMTTAEVSLRQLYNSLLRFERANTNISKDRSLIEYLNTLKKEMQELLMSSDPASMKVGFDRLNNETTKFKTEVETAGKTGQNFFTRLTSQVEKLGIYMSGALVVMKGWQKLTEAVSNVVMLDNALNSLQIVTDMNNQEMQELMGTYQSFASELSATTSQVLAGSEIWLKTRSSKISLTAGNPLESYKLQRSWKQQA